MNAITAVGFDLDGTLFDHAGAATLAINDFFAAFDVAPTAEIRAEWFGSEDTQFERWRSGEISFEEQRRERLRSVLPIAGRPVPTDAQELDALFARYLQAYRAAWRLYDDSARLVRDLRADGYRVGLLTNGATDQQTDKLEHTGLNDAFDAICISAQIGFQKPDPRAFRLLADSLGTDPQQCLFVGDNPAHDIAGARAVGMATVLVDRVGTHVGGIGQVVRAALR